MGYTQVGTIKTTSGQIKKHYTQFTKSELEAVITELKRCKGITLSKHARKSYLNKTHIIQTLRNFNIIEYNYNTFSGESRALLRGRDSFTLDDGLKYNLCAVVSITNKVIVTIYYNLSTDNHSNIDYHRYNRHFNILTHL